MHVLDCMLFPFIIGKDCLLFTVPVCGVQKRSRKTGEQEPHATSRCCRFVYQLNTPYHNTVAL